MEVVGSVNVTESRLFCHEEHGPESAVPCSPAKVLTRQAEPV